MQQRKNIIIMVLYILLYEYDTWSIYLHRTHTHARTYNLYEKGKFCTLTFSKCGHTFFSFHPLFILLI